MTTPETTVPITVPRRITISYQVPFEFYAEKYYNSMYSHVGRKAFKEDVLLGKNPERKLDKRIKLTPELKEELFAIIRTYRTRFRYGDMGSLAETELEYKFVSDDFGIGNIEHETFEMEYEAGKTSRNGTFKANYVLRLNLPPDATLTTEQIEGILYNVFNSLYDINGKIRVESSSWETMIKTKIQAYVLNILDTPQAIKFEVEPA